MQYNLYRPRIRVDFNEMAAQDLVLLSKTDNALDSSGKEIVLSEGLPVYIYEYNNCSDGEEELLVADGVAEANDPVRNGAWTAKAKWCCRIGSLGIRVLSSTAP